MGAKKQITETLVTNSLKDLKKVIKRKRAKASLKPVTMKKDRLIDDEKLFLNTMDEVQEIKEFRNIPLYQKDIAPTSRKKSSEREALDVLEEIVRGRRRIDLSDTQEYVEWIDADYRGDIIKNLHKGKYCVQDCLDLHGVVVEEAEKEVETFIRNSVKKGYRCIKIIHGRGLCSPKGPVLKDAVIKWLSSRYRKYIIAFVTARQCDGGLGALYVLLK
jgi:DNA-nicking Smr family endonuclease